MSVECTLCWQSAVAVRWRPDGTTHNEWVHVFRFTRNTYSEYASRRIYGDMQVDIHCNHVLLGAGDDGELKMAKYSRDKFEVSEVSCTSLSLYTSLLPQSVRLFLLVLLSSEAVSLCLRFRALAPSCFDCSCSISAWSRFDCLFSILTRHDCACAQVTAYIHHTFPTARAQLNYDGYIFKLYLTTLQG